MEHYVFDNLCNHSKEMPLYDIASCLLGESLIGIDIVLWLGFTNTSTVPTGV